MPDLMAADTWGVSHQTFAWWSLGVLLVAIVITAANRPRMLPGTGRDLLPHEVGYLAGGRERAVQSALGQLWSAGAVQADHDGERLGPGTGERPAPGGFLSAVHRAVVGRIPVRELPHEVGEELDTVHRNLVTDGLVPDEKQLRVQRLAGIVLLAGAAIGMLRMLAGIGNADGGRVGLVLAVSAAMAAVGLWFLISLPSRTPAGTAVLNRYRAEAEDLDRPHHWQEVVPERAALAVALFGMPVLLGMDPLLTGGNPLFPPGVDHAGGGDGGASWFGGAGPDGGFDGGDGGGGD